MSVRFCVIGEYGVSSGAKIATRMSAPRITMPATSERLRYQRRSDRRGCACSAVTAASVGAGAVVIGLHSRSNVTRGSSSA